MSRSWRTAAFTAMLVRKVGKQFVARWKQHFGKSNLRRVYCWVFSRSVKFCSSISQQMALTKTSCQMPLWSYSLLFLTVTSVAYADGEAVNRVLHQHPTLAGCLLYTSPSPRDGLLSR